MHQNKNNHQILHTGTLCVRLTPEMLNHLAEPTTFRTSKLDAYLNLLHDAAVATAIYESAYGQTVNPEAAQLVISITNLAKQWGRSRGAVRMFLDQLETLGMLSKTQVSGRTLITMTPERDDAKHSTIPEKPQTTFDMAVLLYYKIDEWLCGIIDDSELAGIIEDAVASLDRSNEDAYSERIIDFQYSLIRRLISKWCANPPVIPENADSYSLVCLEHIFSECLSGNWAMWFKLLRAYCTDPNGRLELVENSTTPASMVDAQYALDNLFNHLKVDFINDSL